LLINDTNVDIMNSIKGSSCNLTPILWQEDVNN